MIARNFRKYPEALALQLTLQFACVVIRRVRARHVASATPKRHAPQVRTQLEAEDIPLRAIVRTPTGKEARVIGYRGGRRTGGGLKDDRTRLVCEYLEPENRRFNKVLLVPELVTVLQLP